MVDKVKSLTRKSKKAFKKKIDKNLKNNPKVFWSYTQSKTKSRSSIPDLLNQEQKRTRSMQNLTRRRQNSSLTTLVAYLPQSLTMTPCLLLKKENMTKLSKTLILPVAWC